jgi:hypothetical protein
MDERFYIIPADGEEMPSDFYQAIKGIEVPVIKDDDRKKNRIWHIETVLI